MTVKHCVRPRKLLLVAALAAAGLLSVGCAAQDAQDASNPAGVHVRTTKNPHGFRGSDIQPYPLPSATFTETSGRPWRFATDARKPVTLLFFGYTNCPDVCSTVMADVAAALRRVDAGTRDKIQVVFVTTDPKRDTPRVIREYLDRFDPSFVGLTAPPDVILKSARQLGVGITDASPLPGGGYEIGHGAQVYGFGPDGKARVVWLEGTPVADFKHDFEKLVTGGADER
ncbi:SCO family protein [Carbonactinospora thermoautotrophica]|uniref:SCO family protein n=1 Tax=Carbonactinospora thermoautotrophica TaxID=1469144 RepID=UPI000AF913DB|nr:SCO family protein [Carbonactinospora thermoautotrophica]